MFASVFGALRVGIPYAGPLKAHMFVDAGNTEMVLDAKARTQAGSIAAAFRPLWRCIRASAGVGLIWPVSEDGVIELNVSHTLGTKQDYDVTSKVQLSFGLNLL